MCKVLICANQKGGVAKSTSVVNLGIGLARKGKRVLLIDNDPQGSLTEALGYPEPDKLETTLANVMEWVLNEEDFDLSAGILHHEEGIDLMPANIELKRLMKQMKKLENLLTRHLLIMLLNVVWNLILKSIALWRKKTERLLEQSQDGLIIMRFTLET